MLLRVIIHGASLLMLVAVLHGGISAQVRAATPVGEYSERLEKAEAIADQMIEEEPPQEDILAAVALIRELVPRSEDIDVSGQNIKVDNNWLHQLLDEIARLSNGDPEQQRSLLIELADRLFVLQERINASIEVSDRKTQLENILSRDEYRPEEEKESIIRKWLRSLWGFISRLLNRLPRPRVEQPQNAGESPFGFFSLALGLLILIAVGYAVFRLARTGRRRKVRRTDEPERVVLGEVIPEGLTAKEQMRRAAEIAGQGDFRTAIRGAFIATLCELEELGKLSLHKSHTNRDYTEALRADTEIFRPFAQMTGRFEKAWYGQARTAASDFDDYLDLYRSVFGSPESKVHD